MKCEQKECELCVLFDWVFSLLGRLCDCGSRDEDRLIIC